LALDHHYPIAIAGQLRRAGHDVVAAVEQGWHREPDEALLALCVAEGRALLTNNVGDFMVIARNWTMRGQGHLGLLLTSDSSLPHTRADIGTHVTLLDAFLRDHPDDNALADQIHWL
jgi:hypothetical protein